MAQDTALRQRGDTSSWEDWKNNILNRYENDTEEHLDAVFNNW